MTMDIEFVKEQLEKHGELHLVVEEHESIVGDEDEEYIGLRDNPGVEFDDGKQVIHIDDGRKCHHIGYDRIVYFEAANEFPD